jgi:hypothetical protein
VWKEIPDLAPYQASSHGRVRSGPWIQRKRNHVGLAAVPHRKPGRILKPDTNRGYPRVQLCIDGKREHRLVHHLVLLAFVGRPADGQICRHLNGVRDDNRPCNLAWGTHAQNSADRFTHGTVPLGEGHKRSKLTAAQVREIKKAISAGERSNKKIAKMFGVTGGAIGAIRHGTTWAHLTIGP